MFCTTIFDALCRRTDEFGSGKVREKLTWKKKELILVSA